MKKLTFLLLLISFGAKAQDNCGYDSTKIPSRGKIISAEIQNQNGSLNFNISFFASDTMLSYRLVSPPTGTCHQ